MPDLINPMVKTALLKTAVCQFQLTVRAYHRALMLSRTIANLAGMEAIKPMHLAEGLQYRPKLELMGWTVPVSINL